ncbi:hypothetical protein INC08_004543, partial [Escherichia coli]|nr:hypothetical protein [Escherichia coli]
MFNNSLISDFILSDNIPQYQNKTWSGEVITRIVGTQYFSISFKVTTNKKYRTDLTNFLALYSSGRPFDMSLGWWGDYSGNQATGIQVTAARTAGATSIQTNTNNLSPGDLIQFS